MTLGHTSKNNEATMGTATGIISSILTNVYVSTIVVAIFLGSVKVARAISLRSLFQYRPAKVWKFVAQGGTWGQVNRPTAGARFKTELPRGEHAIQLYSLGTPNGMKVTCLLEELNLAYGLEYDAWYMDIGSSELQQFSTGFVQANPNSKIPALLHYSPIKEDGTTDSKTLPTRVFESAAIVMHLCEQFDVDGQFLPPVGDPRRPECLSWLFWTHGSAPFLGGGFGHFYHYAPVKLRYAIDRYTMETKRQLHVLEQHLSGQVQNMGEEQGQAISPFAGGPFLCGSQITIADLCCYPWYGRLVQGQLYGASADFLQVSQYPHVLAWAERMIQRKGVRRGCMVNRFSGDPNLPGILKERHSAKDFDTLSLRP
jgi:GST-like protein